MAAIRSALCTISRVWPYPEVLAGGGALTTRSGHAGVYRSFRPDLIMPWDPDTEPATWSRFWSAYLARPEAVREVRQDALWERVVPFRLANVPATPGPAAATARVLLYPSAVAVTITVRASGQWPVAEFAGAMAALVEARTWGAEGNRSLEGIASDLRDLVAPRLAGGVVVAGPPAVHTVAAPLSADGGVAADLDTGLPAVQSCLAGLAGLGPTGSFDPARLCEVNRDTKKAARYYDVGDGLVIWHKDRVFDPAAGEKVACLVRNQTDLVVQIEALRATAQWAADRVAGNRPIPPDVFPLLRQARTRLDTLHTGRRDKTYRSVVATTRITPHLPMLATLSTL
ncbi:hypothetical protein V5P93_004790 [Actinokineospora auranticolor]|uniref:Uncharacterized protein n=1 Tax=Actinokineospora auranticolor TaxID=155976 RepID=A0A2S6GND3_9PSEU|nr:hypothetical protein [Actinokineospora auranticolor]PPK66752.1 hypothetical protein CLV40_109137 [Actinokineospora auranticolor]